LTCFLINWIVGLQQQVVANQLLAATRRAAEGEDNEEDDESTVLTTQSDRQQAALALHRQQEARLSKSSRYESLSSAMLPDRLTMASLVEQLKLHAPPKVTKQVMSIGLRVCLTAVSNWY
jgi:hypothetical protein